MARAVSITVPPNSGIVGRRVLRRHVMNHDGQINDGKAVASIGLTIRESSKKPRLEHEAPWDGNFLEPHGLTLKTYAKKLFNFLGHVLKFDLVYPWIDSNPERVIHHAVGIG